MVLGLSGCHHTPRQAMNDLWGAVPQVRWSGTRVDPPADAVKAEPSVTANVAMTAESPPVDESAIESEAGRPPVVTPVSALQPTESDANGSTPGAMTETQRSPALPSEVVDGDSGRFDRNPDDRNPDVMEPDAGIDSHPLLADSSSDQIERLKAALSDDAERAKSPPRQPGGAHDVRVRVEAMLARARRLFDLGQLREARQAAKVAHDLGDSARLDYSPDEERPIDLVQRIESQLQESKGQPESTAEQSTVAQSRTTSSGESPDRRSEPTVHSAQTGSAPRDDFRTAKEPETDPASRHRRDWGLNVFRRDRKTPATEPVAAIPSTPPRSAPESAGSPVVQMSLELGGESPEDAGHAVVQANRSLTLTPGGDASAAEASAEDSGRRSFDSSFPIGRAPFQRIPPDAESRQAMLDFSDPDVEVRQSPEPEPAAEPWPLDAQVPPVRPTLDEPAPPPADAEEVKPLSPFHDVSDQSLPDIVESVRPDNSKPVAWSWLVGIAGFGVCALIAMFWYRRGAT
jgi:hypothetical protein